MSKQPKQIRTIYTDHLIESILSFMLPIYITRINKVLLIDTGEIITLKSNDKNVYGYLCGVGYNMGYHSIYPNIDQIAYHLGITLKTVSNSLNTLEKAKLIKRSRVKQKGKFDSNHYRVYRPNLIDRVNWLDVNGDILRGKHYNFDYKQFRTAKDDLTKADKLLEGLITLAEREGA